LPAGRAVVAADCTVAEKSGPMTSPGAAVGASLRNAAELALQESQSPDLKLLVKDDRSR
jgi:hypothetical protein